mmetsp:Transcript_57370/g.159653  ORF Transcript_57370/g.159653 Transcript_57370/m.159653 type:complete len:135 (+) Transcript_57370:301-705(+)
MTCLFACARVIYFLLLGHFTRRPRAELAFLSRVVEFVPPVRFSRAPWRTEGFPACTLIGDVASQTHSSRGPRGGGGVMACAYAADVSLLTHFSGITWGKSGLAAGPPTVLLSNPACVPMTPRGYNGLLAGARAS